MYSTSEKLQLPLTLIVKKFKVTKVRQFLVLRDRNDANVRETMINIKTGRKWAVKKTVQEAESRLKHRDIVGGVATGRQGIGVILSPE